MILKIKRQIPNALTIGNLLCGILGIIYALTHIQSDFWLGAYFILIACVFDFLDGFAARFLKVSSNIGKQLDSLADMVSFGVLPGILVYVLLMNILPSHWENVHYFALLIPVFSAYRLAKFNVDERQTVSFIGLPTPANAIFWAGIVLMYGVMTRAMEVFIPTYLILMSIVVFSYLLIAEIEMFSFKFKGFSWKENRVQYLFLMATFLLAITFQQTIHWVVALPIVIVVYISFSIILYWIKKIEESHRIAKF